MISSMYMLPAEHSPCVILLDSEGSKGQQEAYVKDPSRLSPGAIYYGASPSASLQVLHLFPNTATQAARARMLSPLLSALTGVTLKLTGQQVLRCLRFDELTIHLDCKTRLIPVVAVGALRHISSAIAGIQGSVCSFQGQSCTPVELGNTAHSAQGML